MMKIQTSYYSEAIGEQVIFAASIPDDATADQIIEANERLMALRETVKDKMSERDNRAVYESEVEDINTRLSLLRQLGLAVPNNILLAAPED